jgi:hypothetical protein
MKFTIAHKGILRFSGSLTSVMGYLKEHWGSAEQAYEIGVRLIRVPVPTHR